MNWSQRISVKIDIHYDDYSSEFDINFWCVADFCAMIVHTACQKQRKNIGRILNLLNSPNRELTRAMGVCHEHLGYHEIALQWHHYERYGVSNNQRLYCLLIRLFRRRSKKTSKLRVTGFVRKIHQWPVNSPHERPVTGKMFPFDDVIMSRGHRTYPMF